ncbi:MAG: FAD-dependent oxidoreductase, partial [Deltaproteobacteria bacterium]|nr:FAD-dependent oxidoreductase [Deltaproteobacteria bacterium]
LSSNEFLTRVNLMEAYKFPNVDTPVVVGKKVAVVGAGNTAMDSVRTAKRLGSEHAMIVYRRTEKEAPARIEELHHAMEEGIEFYWLTAPVKINGDENGWIKSMECIKMELGPPDESGRRRPVEIKGSNFTMDVDMVICALGTSSNPIVAQTTPGLKVNKWGYIETSEENQMTSIPGVFAGGDIVTGAATVISAMGAGRKAAAGILKFLGI